MTTGEILSLALHKSNLSCILIPPNIRCDNKSSRKVGHNLTIVEVSSENHAFLSAHYIHRSFCFITITLGGVIIFTWLTGELRYCQIRSLALLVSDRARVRIPGLDY